jgi:hypothetical protein
VQVGGGCSAWDEAPWAPPGPHPCAEGLSCVFVGDEGTTFLEGSVPCTGGWCCEAPGLVCGPHSTLQPCP